jgi:hypothetical protein
MPSLYTSGGIFLLYPAMRAAKVLSRADKLYIISMLNKVAYEVPVASLLAAHVMEFEMEPPSLEMCKAPLTNIYGDNWDTKGNFIGSLM